MPTGAAFAHAGGCRGIVLKNSTEKSAEPAAGRIRLYEEPVYLAALVMLSLAVAMVRVVIQHFSKNTVISMVLGHPNSEITCIPPS